MNSRLTGTELAQQLGYRAEHSLGRSGLKAISASRPVTWLLARTLRHADRLVAKVLDGGASATEILVGLPVVTLTATGVRSGGPRSVRLVPVVTPDAFAVLGTNFGGPRTPGWVHNLLADPVATVAYRERRLVVQARVLEGRDREDLLVAAAELYSGFPRYVRWAGHRRVHVFALEADPTAAGG